MYLNCHSYYSFRYGTLSVEDLIALAIRQDIKSLALTDINNTSACFDFIKACTEAGIKPLIGIEFRNGEALQFIALAKNMIGFEKMNRYLSEKNFQKESIDARPPNWEECYIIYPLAETDLVALRENEFIGIKVDEVNRALHPQFSTFRHKMIIQHPVTVSSRQSHEVHKMLRAIDHNTLITKLEQESIASEKEHIVSLQRLLDKYTRLPEAIVNAHRVVDSCSIHYTFGQNQNRKTFTGSSQNDMELLIKLAEDGFLFRYEAEDKEAYKRLQKEIKIIDQMGFSAYFLITWDIIRYAESRGFYHVGRGSGANSIVAYCMRITDVDPIELDLYFERFMNIYRTSPPDFDLDFSWKDRDEIIDYIFKRYGSEHTALLGSYVTFQSRAVLRELGKVYGLPKREIDTLVQYRKTGDVIQDEVTQKICSSGQFLLNYPNHLSIHAGGILIAEKPITSYTALEMPPKGFPSTQFDMYVAENIGLYKFDILSQRGLGHIKDALLLILQNHKKHINIHDVKLFKEDPQVKAQIRRAETIGCFYIESPAMRLLLRKLKCSDYLTLVAASSIIRPGVARSGMMREYIHRFHNPDDFEYIHPKMEDLLKETYGVMVYQEDVIKVAHHFAGLELSESDVLRRGMSGKFRSHKELVRIKEKFMSNCEEMGYPEKIYKEVWRQIESFSGYSFSKAHSASYAVESYQSLYLKSYYPLEFITAVINNFGGFYRSEVYFHEARRCGANILPPCVNRGKRMNHLLGKDIYVGYIHIKDLESKLSTLIEKERRLRGAYKDLEDFVIRTKCSLEQLRLLIRIGAFRFTEKNKKELMWQSLSYFKTAGQKDKMPDKLFQIESTTYELPKIEDHWLEDAYEQMELMGFPLCSPFDMLKNKPSGYIYEKEMIKHVGKRVSMLGYFVIAKNTTTVNKKLMQFGTFIDEKGDFFDTVHFPNTVAKFPLRGIGIYYIQGRLTEDFGCATLEVSMMKKCPYLPNPVYNGLISK